MAGIHARRWSPATPETILAGLLIVCGVVLFSLSFDHILELTIKGFSVMTVAFGLLYVWREAYRVKISLYARIVAWVLVLIAALALFLLFDPYSVAFILVTFNFPIIGALIALSGIIDVLASGKKS